MDGEMRSTSVGKEIEEVAKGTVRGRERDIIAFTPSLRPSAAIYSDREPIKGHKGSDAQPLARNEKGGKRQEHIFVCQHVTAARPAWRARFQSRSYEKCQECFHLGSFYSSLPLSVSFWSYLPLWVVVIGGAVYLLSAGREAVAFEMLSLCSLNRRRQT